MPFQCEGMRDYLKTMRIALKLTQEQLAAKINVTRQYYNLIENGNRQKSMDLDLIEKLALAFNMPVGELVEQESRYKSDIA